MKKIYTAIKNIYKTIKNDNITVYSAYASFYVVISFIPFLMIILATVGHFITLSYDDIMNMLGTNIPQSVSKLILYVVDEVLNANTASIISLQTLTLLWTASRSVVAIEKGLDSVYKATEKRSFIRLNLQAMFYTFTFVVAILFSLLIMVFGNVIAVALGKIFPVALEIINLVLSTRAIVSLFILTLLFTCVYTFMPYKKLKFIKQLPGAVFAASGWMIFSLFFSIYVDNFSKKSYIYGSLTALIILMLWIYFCMIILFIGGEINNYLLSESVDKKSL